MREPKLLTKGEFTHCEMKMVGPAGNRPGPDGRPYRTGQAANDRTSRRSHDTHTPAAAAPSPGSRLRPPRPARRRRVHPAARAAGPAGAKYRLDRVDPDGALDQDDRERRARAAKAEYFNRIAYLSSRARRARAG